MDIDLDRISGLIGKYKAQRQQQQAADSNMKSIARAITTIMTDGKATSVGTLAGKATLTKVNRESYNKAKIDALIEIGVLDEATMQDTVNVSSYTKLDVR